jgi:hypothetical protein
VHVTRLSYRDSLSVRHCIEKSADVKRVFPFRLFLINPSCSKSEFYAHPTGRLAGTVEQKLFKGLLLLTGD